ncbi:short-chain dehydrogenase/reductase family protein-like protein [Lophiotrema nucula]|uniref:Short-chain dehydrogenase/reductase family protein-like protein n=1 Tax=Lophiotrema nucula TaxID=690887 RepID=A0A6A5ZBS2_9PLEO|nr:short-chain dehydrogenase/reductase family protein-like protein [Lophiotrema nucula]
MFRVLKHKWITPAKVVDETYEGRNVIVTGANTGVGFEAAAKFAEKGASKVILAVRTLEKGEHAKKEIEARTHQKCHIDVWELDMTSYDSVVAFAQRAATLDHLDIAVLNAGVHKVPFAPSKYGWEEDLQVNALSTTLLSILLLPKLKASKQPGGKTPILEIINSGLHQRATLDPQIVESSKVLQGYNKEENFKPNTQYSRSKLFLMYATNTLAENVSPKDVIIVSVCPGMTASELGRDYDFPGAGVALWVANKALMRPAEQGALVYISGTTVGEIGHGRFYQYDVIQPIAPTIEGEKNKKIAQGVWNEIVESLGKDVPSFQEYLQEAIGKA